MRGCGATRFPQPLNGEQTIGSACGAAQIASSRPPASSNCGRRARPSHRSRAPGGRPTTRSPNTSTTSHRYAEPAPAGQTPTRAPCAASPPAAACKPSRLTPSGCCKPPNRLAWWAANALALPTRHRPQAPQTPTAGRETETPPALLEFLFSHPSSPPHCDRSRAPRKATDKGPDGPKTFRLKRSLTLAENFSPGPLRYPRQPGRQKRGMKAERKDGNNHRRSMTCLLATCD